MKILAPFERNIALQKAQEVEARELNKRADTVEKLKKEESEIKSRLEAYQINEYRKFEDKKKEQERELNTLTLKVKDKKAEMDALLQPLEKQFAVYVRTERKKIENERYENASTRNRLEGVEESLKNREKKVEIAENYAKQNRLKALSELEDVQKYAENVKKELDKKNNGIIALYKEAEMSRNAAVDIENSAKALEAQLKVKESELQAKEKELDDRELKIVLKEIETYSPVN